MCKAIKLEEQALQTKYACFLGPTDPCKNKFYAENVTEMSEIIQKTRNVEIQQYLITLAYKPIGNKWNEQRKRMVAGKINTEGKLASGKKKHETYCKSIRHDTEEWYTLNWMTESRDMQ